MKFFCLLIFALGKLANGNDATVKFDKDGDLTPALLFVAKYKGIFLVSDKNYSLKKVVSRGELLLYTCPPSDNELSVLDVKIEIQQKKHSKPEENGIEEESPRSPLSNEEENSDLTASELSEDDDDDEENESVETMRSSLFMSDEPDQQWSPTNYFCQYKYKPQTRSVTKCSRMKGEVEESGDLFAVSYKINFLDFEGPKNNKRDVRLVENELFVYAKCNSEVSSQSLYAFYKPVPFVKSPTPSEELSDSSSRTEYQPINYDAFDPNIYPKEIIARYYLNEQKNILKALDEKITDEVIPQRLIPTYHITEEYSRGTVANDLDLYSPQWLSKAKIWDDLQQIIFNHAKKLKWLVYTGTTGTYETPKKKPIPIVLKKESGSTLSVPLYWWTFVMKTNTSKGRGIILAMLNEPINSHKKIYPTSDKLCSPLETCDGLGWREIINMENAPYLKCCRVTGDLTKRLMNDSFDFDVLRLAIEEKAEKDIKDVVQDRIEVSSLLKDLRRIKNISLKNRSSTQSTTISTPSATSSSPSSPEREISSKPELGRNTSRISSTSSSPPSPEQEISPKSRLSSYASVLSAGVKKLPKIRTILRRKPSTEAPPIPITAN